MLSQVMLYDISLLHRNHAQTCIDPWRSLNVLLPFQGARRLILNLFSLKNLFHHIFERYSFEFNNTAFP